MEVFRDGAYGVVSAENRTERATPQLHLEPPPQKCDIMPYAMPTHEAYHDS